MRRPRNRPAAGLLVVLCALAAAACRAPGVDLSGDEWRGPAIAYSGYREGQSPDSELFPSQDEVEQDLRLLARNWRLIRVYAANMHGEDVLEVIRREKLDLKVMLGVWLDREPGAEQRNARSIADGIRLANEYEDVVVAVNVGNEVLIEWTEHPGARETGDPLRARGQGFRGSARDRGGQLRVVARPRERAGA